MAGMEALLAEELQDLGMAAVQERKRAVVFRADNALLYRTIVHSRLALRIHRILYTEQVWDAESLYEALASWDWSRNIRPEHTIAVDALVHSRHFPNSLFVAQKAKDGIVDRVRMRHGRRPSVDLREPDFRIQVRIEEQRLEVALDAVGSSMHRRGYRSQNLAAPLNEVLAAGLLKHAGYTGECAFADLCCGTGTLPIEAAWIAQRVAPGLHREAPVALLWKDADEGAWTDAIEAAKAIRRKAPFPIQASDRSPAAVAATRENALMAHVEQSLQIRQCRFREARPLETEGIMVCNPPYGERLATSDLQELYAGFGDAMKSHWSGWRAWLFSANIDALKAVGLKPMRRVPLRNGPLDARLYGFDLYQGSRKVAPSGGA
jgi:putative N6-adenine-specific DNA methylase